MSDPELEARRRQRANRKRNGLSLEDCLDEFNKAEFLSEADMTLAHAAKLGFKARHTSVGAQKINGSTLETFGMVLASFQVEDKLGRARFFQETFLLANTSIEVVLGMPFLTLSKATWYCPRCKEHRRASKKFEL